MVMTDDVRIIENLGLFLFVCGGLALLGGLATVPNPKLLGVLIVVMVTGIGLLIMLIGSQIPTRKELKKRCIE